MVDECSPSTKRRRRKASAPVALTLRDVAKAAGVSVASASRALTRPDLVSEQVREQVERAARAMGYVPNAAAQALSGHPRSLVGVILGSMDDPIVARMLDEMAPLFAARDVALMTITGAQTEAETAKCLRELDARRADVVLFGGGAVPVRAVGEVDRSRAPWASLDAADPAQRLDSASGFDRARAHALAVRYLRDLGHRHVALLAGGGEPRAAAVRAALGETDVELSSVAATGDMRRAIAEGLQQLLAQPTPPSAMICDSDTVAAWVLDECQRQGIAVPRLLTVIGLGDSELARHTLPALTTLRVPARDAGVAAAEYVFALLEGRVAASPNLAVKVIVRESS